jgi:hypothetical protein
MTPRVPWGRRGCRPTPRLEPFVKPREKSKETETAAEILPVRVARRLEKCSRRGTGKAPASAEGAVSSLPIARDPSETSEVLGRWAPMRGSVQKDTDQRQVKEL